MMRKSLLAMLLILAFCAAAQELPIPQDETAPAYQPKFAGDKARSEAEAAALGYMRTVVTAEKLYKRKHGHYTQSLAALVGSGSFTRRMTKTERGEYRVSFRPRSDGYALALTPRGIGPDQRAFYVDASGQLRAEESKPANERSPLLQ